MSTVPYEQAKEQLDRLCDEAISSREPILLHQPGREDIAIIAADELAGYIETAHLLSSPENARRLLASLERSRAGEGQPTTVEDLKRKFETDGVDRR